MFDSNSAISASIREEISHRLHQVEVQEGVCLLMAVESGSRAWGFPSPDSDYDVRFLYVRPRDWYLQLKPGRDVIEHAITDEIDLNGWDIRKTLGLLLKSNAVVSEWIESPIRYRDDHSIVHSLRTFADSVLNGRALALHYASLGTSSADRWLDKTETVPVKKYFYALRPALAIRHLRLSPEARPPMNLQRLLEGCGLTTSILTQIETLVVAKSQTNELSNGARMPELDSLIRNELGRAAEVPGRTRLAADALHAADNIFLELVNAL